LFSPPVIESMIQNAGLRVASSVGIIPAESTVIRRVATLAEKVKIFRLRDRLADLFPQYHPVTDWRRRFCSTLVYEVVKRDHE